MSEVEAIALLVASVAASAFWIVTLFRLAGEINHICDRTESDLRDNFPSANPQPPAESTQETAASTASR